MGEFADRVLAQLHDAGALSTVLTGTPAATYPHLARLVDEVYATDGVDVDQIRGVTVLSVRRPGRPGSGRLRPPASSIVPGVSGLAYGPG